MAEQDDYQLLAQFARENSEAAFALLVERHVNLVYSVGLRQTGNAHAAEEIAQAVFVILARKAASLGSKTILSGWLYQTTRLTAANYRRTEFRRTRREQEAYMQSVMNESNPSADDHWRQMAPLLDDALCKLVERDRNAIVLRFFENKSLSEIGSALGTSEDAAKVRVNRALEKLREAFTKHRVMLTGTLIAAAVSANSIQAAPVGLTATIVTTAAKGTAISATITTLVNGTLKTLTWLKLKLVAGVGLAVLLAGSVAVVEFSGGSTQTNRSANQPEETALIVPGASVGKVRSGMTTNEVKAVLGRPDKWRGKIMVYDRKLGTSVAQSKAGALIVFCGDSMLKYPGVKKFKGRTKEGIGMESNREEVTKSVSEKSFFDLFESLDSGCPRGFSSMAGCKKLLCIQRI